MRFHILGVPHTVSSLEYVACAFTQKIVKLCSMLQGLGHEVYHYGHKDSEVDCTEHITVLWDEDLEKAYGSYNWREEFFKHDMGDHAYQSFFARVPEQIRQRQQPNDFLLCMWGSGHKPIADACPDLIAVEPGIGYSQGHFAQFRVYESYAIMHTVQGWQHAAYCDPKWYHTVIPNYFDLSQFECKEDKEDYFLFLGRVYEGKGVNLAIQAAEFAGVKLKVAGQGGIQKEMGHLYPNGAPDHVEEVGYADVEKRKELMANAKGLLMPTLFNEPFGGVMVEALLSGTPVITTDWGAFSENNLQGITGYRCRTMGDFVQAIKNVQEGKISSKICRQWAENNFSMERVALMYEKFFKDVYEVFVGDGWYSDLSDLSYAEKYYPSELTTKQEDLITFSSDPLQAFLNENSI